MEDCSRYDSLRQIEARKMTDDLFVELEQERRPFIITNVVGLDFCTWWKDDAIQKMGSKTVHFINGNGLTTERTLMEGTFSVVVDESEKLSDRSNFAYMDVTLDSAPDLTQTIYKNVQSVVPVGDKSLFPTWPAAFRPVDLSLMVAGEGARNRLSCEGLDAGEWYLCLAGHMRLKMLPDDSRRLEALDARSEPVGILNDKREPLVEICRRCSSQLDLFQTEFIGSSPASHLDSYGPDFHRWPRARELPRALEVLLKPGEMLVVPGKWWRQCYFDEPSWTLRGQFLSAGRLRPVLLDMLKHTGYDDSKLPPLEGLSPEQMVDISFILVLGSKGGDGRLLLNKLREHEMGVTSSASPSAQTTKNAVVCAICGRPAKTHCGRCKKLPLCGSECQRRSWPDHKKVCIKAR